MIAWQPGGGIPMAGLTRSTARGGGYFRAERRSEEPRGARRRRRSGIWDARVRLGLLACLGLMVLAGVTAGCAPKARVVLPPDWQPRAQTTTPNQSAARPTTATAPEKTAAVRPPSTITERDLAAAPSSDAAAGDAAAGLSAVPADQAPRKAAAEPPDEPKSPQRVASLHLVDEGNRNLAQGQLDEAIALFEQAIQIDGYNGDAFFGLANAWQRRDAPKRALEFARKAEILLQKKSAKLKQVLLLEAEILEGLDDWQTAAGYRAKAGRL